MRNWTMLMIMKVIFKCNGKKKVCFLYVICRAGVKRNATKGCLRDPQMSKILKLIQSRVNELANRRTFCRPGSLARLLHAGWKSGRYRLYN